MGKHALEAEAVLPLVSAALTVAPQRHVGRAVADVVWGHHGACERGDTHTMFVA